MLEISIVPLYLLLLYRLLLQDLQNGASVTSQTQIHVADKAQFIYCDAFRKFLLVRYV